MNLSSNFSLTPAKTGTAHPMGNDLRKRPSNKKQQTQFSCVHGCSQNSLGDFLLDGFLTGFCSDITVCAFGKEYKLHKLILTRSQYFRALLSRDWGDDTTRFSLFGGSEEAQGAIKLEASEAKSVLADPNITQESFELAIASLYGATNKAIEKKLAINMISTGQYLGIPELVCQATESIISDLSFDTLAKYAVFAYSQDLGASSSRILESVKSMLCCDGWENGAAKWDWIPHEIVCEVVASDSFFVLSEWDRCLFILKLIERRVSLKSSEEEAVDISTTEELDASIAALRHCLNTSIHFCHLTFEQLEYLETLEDENGNSLLDSSALKESLWTQTSLQKLVMSAPASNTELQSLKYTEQRPANHYIVPINDETIHGPPTLLDDIIFAHQVEEVPIIKNEPVPQEAAEETESSELEKETPLWKKIISEPAPAAKVPTRKIHHWSKFPSFRFCVAFCDISALETEKRLYSKSSWYAGCYWSLYLQKIKKNGKYHLGVYLHRAASSAPPSTGFLNPNIFKNHDINGGTSEGEQPEFESSTQLLEDEISQMVIDDDMIGVTSTEGSAMFPDYSSTPTTGFFDGIGSAEEEQQDRVINYEDHRKQISVYFTIRTPSQKMKSNWICFTSSPSLFSVSQSWGWKSHSMCSFNEDGTLQLSHDKNLKFMVTLGGI